MKRFLFVAKMAVCAALSVLATAAQCAAGDVAASFAGAADGRLGKYIATDAEYSAYLGWVEANRLDHETVTNSARAWFSYAVGASNLVERAFADDDVKIVSLDVFDGGFTFEVDVKDVALGASSTEKSLATVFEVLGSPSLSEDSFATNDVQARLGVSANGRLQVQASSTAPHETFFVRVRMFPDESVGDPVPEHDYSGDYLTFRILTSGTICWKAFGNLTKTLEYKINNGEWTPITSTSGGVTISVAKDDVVRFRGSNTTYATSKSAYSGFEGGTATYDIEGNIMSLLYGDDFAESTTLPNSDYIFCSLFKKAPVISRKTSSSRQQRSRTTAIAPCSAIARH